MTGLNRVYRYVSEPTYMIFPANKENNKRIGLVISPGGGFRNVWLDKEKIGVMGFSAGGRLAQIFTFSHYNGDYGWKPAFAALIYDSGDVEKFNKVPNPENLPPVFMAVAGNDSRLNIVKNIDYLARAFVTVKKLELHVYSDGGHGFGLAYDDNSSVSDWKNAFIYWIDSLY